MYSKIQCFVCAFCLIFSPGSWAGDNTDQQQPLHVVNGQVFQTSEQANAYLDTQRPALLQQIDAQAKAGGYAATVVFDNQPVSQGIRVGNPEHIAAFQRQDVSDANTHNDNLKAMQEHLQVMKELKETSRRNAQTVTAGADPNDPIVKQTLKDQENLEKSIGADAQKTAQEILNRPEPSKYNPPRVLVSLENSEKDGQNG